MRFLTLGVAVCCVCVGVAVHAQAPDPQVMAPINKFLEAFNKGDTAGAAATHAAEADLSIIDEVPPFHWQGAQAFQAWTADLGRDEKKRGVTDQKVSIRAATRIETDGAVAYVVVPASYTFKQAGVPMKETAQMTFMLKKVAGGWLIHGWTWTGGKPQKVAAAATK